jgi:type II secretory ATPase GspE/PulE/Tfp pilus assembly ATPase PilB-like protein
MKIEPYLVASSLVCSLSQRLARRICRHCAEADTDIAPGVRKEMATALGLEPDAVQASRGRGCVECNQKGHRGRVAIYELFLVNEAVADLIQPGAKTSQLREEARKSGWRSLRENAWRKVQRGLIPISEQERWTRRIDTGAAAKPSS